MSMQGVETSESELHERLTAILRAMPPLMQVLSVARGLCLPDWLVFSGAVYQPVLNHLTHRPLDYGIKDYDLGYFDGSDLSYEAEDAVIRRVEAAFDEPLRSMVEVRNQARVHSGLRQSSASHMRPSPARLRHYSVLPRQHSRSACDLNPMTGCTSRLPSVSPTCSRCACGPILTGRRWVSPGLLLMCDAAGPKSSLRTSHRSGLGMALRNRSQRRSSGCWGDISTRDGFRARPNRGARMAAPQEMTKGKESWLNTAHIFLLSYPIGQLGTGGAGNDQDPG